MTSTHQARTEVRDGMRIDWDVEIRMDDGLVLKADVFRPTRDGRWPVILTSARRVPWQPPSTTALLGSSSTAKSPCSHSGRSLARCPRPLRAASISSQS